MLMHGWLGSYLGRGISMGELQAFPSDSVPRGSAYLPHDRYDASAHLAEETHEASDHVATGMWAGTLCSWLLSIPVSISLQLALQRS